MSESAPPPPAAPLAPAAPAAPAAQKQRGPMKSIRSTVPQAVPLRFTSGISQGSDRILIYGTGGIGKTTAAAFLPAPVFFDLEYGTKKMAVLRDDVKEWIDLRGKLASFMASPADGARTVVVDSGSVAEELAKEHVLQTKKTEKGEYVSNIAGFGWNRGWDFVYDEFCGLLADLDRIAEAGFNVCMIAHDVSNVIPNPDGGDYLRWEPHFYNGDKNHKSSIRDRVKQWAEHIVYIAYDNYVVDGKVQGSGSRTIHTVQLGTHVAKSRTSQFSIPFTADDCGAVWRQLGIS